jgi:hypothetical protein
MNRFERGYTFKPGDFERVGTVGLYPLFRADDNLAYVLEFEDGAVLIQTNTRKPIPAGQTGITLGANPCLAYVSIDARGQVLLGHVIQVEPYDVKVFEKTVHGIAGGGRVNISDHRDLLKQHGFKIMEPPPVADYAFAAVVVRRNLPDVPRGVFYCYSSMK